MQKHDYWCIRKLLPNWFSFFSTVPAIRSPDFSIKFLARSGSVFLGKSTSTYSAVSCFIKRNFNIYISLTKLRIRRIEILLFGRYKNLLYNELVPKFLFQINQAALLKNPVNDRFWPLAIQQCCQAQSFQFQVEGGATENTHP